VSEYKSIAHCKYLCQYHIVFCPKFRYAILKDDVEKTLKNILKIVADKYEFVIIQMEIMDDHVHLFVGAKPTVAPIDIVRTLKSITAIELFKLYPKLKMFYGRCGSLWSRGKFISTIGNVSAETIKKYIAEQKGM
jgi:putative transposase